MSDTNDLVDVFSEYATDPELENSGTWFPLGKKSRLLIARAGNRAYVKALNAQVERNQMALNLEDDNAQVISDQIKVDVMAETLLLGWENLAFKGEKLEYTPGNARKVLAVKDFRLMVARMADNWQAFKVKQEVDQGKA